jgi:hypothetical protein
MRSACTVPLDNKVSNAHYSEEGILEGILEVIPDGIPEGIPEASHPSLLPHMPCLGLGIRTRGV